MKQKYRILSLLTAGALVLTTIFALPLGVFATATTVAKANISVLATETEVDDYGILKATLESGASAKLANDIVVPDGQKINIDDKTVTLDLNGHILNGNSGGGIGILEIDRAGKVTVTDTSATKNGHINNLDADGAAVRLEGTGQFELLAGTLSGGMGVITGEGAGSNSIFIRGGKVEGAIAGIAAMDSTVTIEGGTITGGIYGAVVIYGSSEKCTFTGGTFIKPFDATLGSIVVVSDASHSVRADAVLGEDVKFSPDVTPILISVSSDTYISAITESVSVVGITYDITVQSDENGKATASHASAEKGTEIMLTATPNSGYEFKEWQVLSADATVTVSGNKFVMPAASVLVKAIFEKILFRQSGTQPTALASSQIKVASKYVYTGRDIKPVPTVTASGKTLKAGVDYTVRYARNRACGNAILTINAVSAAYSGSKSVNFRIVPKKLAKPTVKVGKRSLSVKWKAGSGKVTGYQISYKQNGRKWKAVSVKGSSLSKALKKLKRGKRYSVKVRAWKNIGGKKYYGPWSATKTSKMVK